MGAQRAAAGTTGRAGVTHLLVTNDFPPKVGGIQTYLWELWRRLDPEAFAVLTASSQPGAPAFDRMQAHPASASSGSPAGCSLPAPAWSAGSGRAADRVGAELVVLDPAFPSG